MKMAQTWTQVRGIRKHTSSLGKLSEAVWNDQKNVTSQTEDQGLNATSTTYQQMNFPEHHFCFFLISKMRIIIAILSIFQNIYDTQTKINDAETLKINKDHLVNNAVFVINRTKVVA